MWGTQTYTNYNSRLDANTVHPIVQLSSYLQEWEQDFTPALKLTATQKPYLTTQLRSMGQPRTPTDRRDSPSTTSGLSSGFNSKSPRSPTAEASHITTAL